MTSKTLSQIDRLEDELQAAAVARQPLAPIRAKLAAAYAAWRIELEANRR